MRFASTTHARARLTFAGCALTLICISGCASTAPQTGFMSSVEGIDVTKEEMRQRTQDATVRFAIIIAETGNRIMLASDDPEIRRNALRWKIGGVSMVHRAGFHFDPLIGLLDLGVLSYQMDAFFTSGPGRDAFGSHQPLALAAIERIGEELRREARKVADSAHLSIPGNFIREWAAEHPLVEPYELRPSVASDLMSLMNEADRSAIATVGTMADELSALSSRLTIYAEHLPYQARWQAEYLLDERGLDGKHVVQMQADISALRAAVERMAPEAGGSIPVIAQVDLSNLQPQLRPYIDSLREYGEAAINRALQQRDVLVEYVSQERALIMQDMEALSDRVITTTTDRLAKTLTGWLWAGVLILLLLLAIPFWLGLLTGKVLLRRSG